MTTPFRLAVVLKLRERQRDEAARSLDEVRRAIGIVDERTREIEQDFQMIEQEKSQWLMGDIPVHQLLNAQRYQYVLTGQLQHLASQRSQLHAEQIKREQVLVQCQKAVRSLEKLSDAQQALLASKQRELQQSRQDEWSNNRSARSRISREPT